MKWGKIPDVAPVLKALYSAEPDRLFWFNGSSPTPRLEATVASLVAAGDHGLDPADYDAALLKEQWTAVKGRTIAGADRALFDLGVSVGVARILKAVHMGRVDPATMYWGYDVTGKELDIPALMRTSRDEKGLAATLDSLSPAVSHYTRARHALAVYKALARAGEPETVPDLPKGQTKVEAGKSWVGLKPLAARLRVLGDLPRDATVDGATYNPALVTAVKQFQQRHGLDADGVIGAGTIRAVNVKLAQRVRQIELAMERMRWLPALSDQPNVFVNVPLFRLWATDPGTGARTPPDERRRRQVAQSPDADLRRADGIRDLPALLESAAEHHGERDPAEGAARPGVSRQARTWRSSPAAPTTRPRCAATPENLSQVVAGRLHLRQRPGPHNSLGLAKFIFPNDENVYMHGTPAQQLFSRARRDFSHGCIRLENPERFAEWVLRDQPEWTQERIEAAMQGERPTRVNLKHPLTVVLFYDTVHVNSEGVMFFVEDIYGHDRALDAALARGYPYPVKN